MKKAPAITLGLALFAACAAPSHAGIYSDDLAKCLVASTTEADRSLLVRWIFSIAALHPDVATTSAVTAAQREATDRATGKLIEHLLTVACRQQTREALKYEGAQAMQSSFQVLGQVAMRTLVEHPSVARGFQGMARHVNEQKIRDLAK